MTSQSTTVQQIPTYDHHQVPLAPDPPQVEYAETPASLLSNASDETITQPTAPSLLFDSANSFQAPSFSGRETIDMYEKCMSQTYNAQHNDRGGMLSGRMSALSVHPLAFFVAGVLFGSVAALLALTPLFCWRSKTALAQRNRTYYLVGAVVGFILCITWIALLFYFLIKRDIGL